jgi:Na+-translocating ferredoxin:NAD+ oxidoreductase RnfE subunit
VPEVFPEAVTVIGGPLVIFVVGGLKAAVGEGATARYAVLLTISAGVLVAALIYAAGFVSLEGLTPVQATARTVLSGIGMAMAASGARSWVRTGGTGNGGTTP